MTAGELRARRAAAQRLDRPGAAGPADLVRALLAVQAQDARAARLALRARQAGLDPAVVDTSVSDDRSLVVAWLMRGTLHLVAREDHAWLLGLAAPRQEAGSARRLAQEGVPSGDAERALAVVERALAGDGPLTRAELGARIAEAGVRSEGQALPHLLALAARRGIAVHGPVAAGEQRFALARDWLGAVPAVPLAGAARDTALAELARRYLAAHGPATAADLAAWAGLPLRDARAGLSAIASELVEREDGLVHLAKHIPVAEIPTPRLLGAFDPVLLGWTSRERILGPHTHLVTMNGIFRPFALVKGRAAANWKLERGRVAIEPLGRVTKQAMTSLEADAADVERFIAG